MTTDEPDPEIDQALGASTRAVWTRRTALVTHTPGEVATFVRTGQWQAPWPGVYADGGFVLGPVQRGWAAVLASGGEGQPVVVGPPDAEAGPVRTRLRAIAVGRTAARFWEFPLIDDDDPATGAREHLIDDVAVVGHARTLHRIDELGWVHELRRHRFRFATDEVGASHGLYVASALRTVLDCALLLSLEAAVSVADHALHVERIGLADLAAAVKSRRRQPGARRLAQVLELCDGRAESPGETLARLLLAPVLPGLRPQVKLRADDGRLLARFDLADEELRLVVEHDGRAGHEGRAADDHRRDAVSRRHGWTTERVTWFDVRRRQEQTVRRVVARAEELRRGRAA